MKPGKEHGGVLLETDQEVRDVGGALYEIDPSPNGLGLKLIDVIDPPYEIDANTVTLALEGLQKELESQILSGKRRNELEVLRLELIIKGSRSIERQNRSSVA